MTSPAGTFDINLPLSATLGVEDRNGAGSHTVVLTFDGPVTSGSASVTGTASAGTPTFSGNEMSIPLSGVANQQTVTVTANNVMSSGGGVLASASVDVGFLIGDTTNDGTVNSADIGQTKSQSGNPVTGSNFRQDVTNDGTINSADISLVKSKSGTAL